MFGRNKAAQEQARQDIQETNDVLSQARPRFTNRKDQDIYEEGMRLTRLKRDSANRTLGD